MYKGESPTFSYIDSLHLSPAKMLSFFERTTNLKKRNVNPIQNATRIARLKYVQDMTTAERGSAGIRGVKTHALHKSPARWSADETGGD